MKLRLTEEQQGIKHPRVSVVIPTLNEAQNLYYVLPFIPPLVSEVILVDGDSRDNTVAVARQLLPTIKIIQQTGKGKGNALRAGFTACKGDIIVMLDADGSTDPAEIPRFVETLMKGFDCAKGSRLLKEGGSYDLNFIRRLGNSFLCRLVNTLFHTHISDLCYGYNAFWKDCLKRVDINCDGFEVETQIYLRMYKAQL
jgi:glycosyltransferase involved in cell wall biosynthesis